MTKHYRLIIDFCVEINDKLKTKICRQDDLEKIAEFYLELIKDNEAIFEYLKNRCVFYFIDLDTEDLIEPLEIEVGDQFMIAPAERCRPEITDFVKKLLCEEAREIFGVDRLDKLLNLIDDQFKIPKVVTARFEEIKPQQEKDR